MGRGEDAHLIYFLDDITSDGVNVVKGIDIIAEEFNAHRALLISRNDIDRVTLGAEGTAGKSHVVAFVLDIHQQTEEAVPVQLLIHGNNDRTIQIGLRSTQAINAGHGGHNHHVSAGQQRRGGRVAQTLYVLVDGRVLFNIGIRLRNISLWLVVVIIRHEVLHRVMRQELAQLVR